MKKLFFLVIISAFQLTASAQRVRHHGYITYYNATRREPDSVSWDLTPGMVSGQPVANHGSFKMDPRVYNCAAPGDYERPGYCIGLLFNQKDASGNVADSSECLYMSNALPQNIKCNGSDWQTIEDYVRTLAAKEKVHVVAGGWGSMAETTKGGLSIPERLWKAVYTDGRWLVWIVDNTDVAVGHDYRYWFSTLDQLNAITRLNLQNSR